MKKLFCIILVVFVAVGSFSQKLSQVSFPNGTQLSFFSILTDQGVQIRISEYGKILEWGMEVMSERYNYYAPRLQPFNARTEYYPPDSDSAFKGKVKSIGTTFITYYGAHEEESKRGKLKSLGFLQFDYYSSYEDKSMQGKLKLLGNLYLEYYRPYDNEAFRGKLKSIGSLPIVYYSAFDDKYNIGKIKSIGSVPYSWYSPHDLNRSGLKANNYRNNISGIIFILQ